MIALGIIYLGLGLGQGLIRNALWHFYQTSAAHPLIKNLIFFVFIFSFAPLRLWVTLLVLTWGLKQSYVARRLGRRRFVHRPISGVSAGRQMPLWQIGPFRDYRSQVRNKVLGSSLSHRRG